MGAELWGIDFLPAGEGCCHLDVPLSGWILSCARVALRWAPGALLGVVRAALSLEAPGRVVLSRICPWVLKYAWRNAVRSTGCCEYNPQNLQESRGASWR